MKSSKSAFERTVLIRLVAGGTPRLLRRAMKRAGYSIGLQYSAMSPRVLVCWILKADLTNAALAAEIAASIPASTVHVADLGELANAVGPNYRA